MKAPRLEVWMDCCPSMDGDCDVVSLTRGGGGGGGGRLGGGGGGL